jgi:hypothetical protein
MASRYRISALLTAPEFVWELSLGIYLIAVGFKASSPLLGIPQRARVDDGALAAAGATA